MPKNLFQDMVKVNNTRREIKPKPVKVAPKETPTHNNTEKIVDRGGPRYMLWFVAFCSFLFFFFALSYLFSKVTVKIDLKKQNITLNEDLSATKDGDTESLSFDLVVISGEENTTMQVFEQKETFAKAEGIVVLYNTFSSAPQTLSIDTRLEGSNGKIYKTKTQTVVPGMSKDKTPGSVEVKIYANENGPDYNSFPLDFTILGFKGSSKYSKFYGRSKGGITGGVNGKVPFISDSQKADLLNEMKVSLETKLFKKAKEQIPAGFILFKDAVFFSADDNIFDFSSVVGDVLPMKQKGTLYGILFNEIELTKKIAENNIDKYDGSPVSIPNIRDLKFISIDLMGKNDVPLETLKDINFNLSGNINIVWKLDTEKFIIDLLNKPKKDFNKILLQYPSIDSAKVAIRPFWKKSFPDKIKNIEVIINLVY